MEKPHSAFDNYRPPLRRWRAWVATEPSLAGLSWTGFRHKLRHGPRARHDELLAGLVRLAREDREAVGALAACLVPGLRARIARYAPGLPADDAWGAALVGLCAAIDRAEDLENFVASRLLEAAKQHLQLAVRGEARWQDEVREVPERAGPDRVDEPSAALMLASAAGAGVIDRRDAWLLHATVIGGHSLDFAGRRLGLGYEATKKRRQRAGHRWAIWWELGMCPTSWREREAR